jgi:hypothetical protein
MERLTPYLLNRSKSVYLKANVISQYLCVDSLLLSNPATPQNQENVKPLLPENIDFDTNIEAQKFRYQNFEAERMKANLAYRPLNLEIKSIDFSVMSGRIRGSGAIANDKSGNLRVLGETTLSRVDVRQLFATFDNFGQDVFRAEHVNGKLSGELGFAVGWNSKMQLQQNTILVEGSMDLDGGELVNFEPLNSLSKFVALEELQNIRFSKLRTQISIRNKKLTIPRTDVQTSSFDILCEGEHNFDNSYTYRVKILLSELLAAKARKAKRENSENEYVEDGGKRTALYLKIAGQGDKFNINYDKQSAKASVKEDIRNETQTLKNLLKINLGLFKKDTTTITPKPKTPDNNEQLQFIFDWE